MLSISYSRFRIVAESQMTEPKTSQRTTHIQLNFNLHGQFIDHHHTSPASFLKSKVVHLI